MITSIIRMAAVSMFLGTVTANAAPVVYFDFDGDGLEDVTHTVTEAGMFTADVYVAGVDTTHDGLLSWGTQLDFDNSLLTASSYEISPTWPLPGMTNQVDNASGNVELLATAFTGSSGTQLLYSINFTADNVGSALLSLQEIFPDNLSFSGFVGADGHDYDPEVLFGSASISITAIPVPAAIYLFISGLGLLVIKSRSSLAG